MADCKWMLKHIASGLISISETEITMPIHNAGIVEIFNAYAELLEIKCANQYRVRA